jgi:hypothetical protein
MSPPDLDASIARKICQTAAAKLSRAGAGIKKKYCDRREKPKSISQFYQATGEDSAT